MGKNTHTRTHSRDRAAYDAGTAHTELGHQNGKYYGENGFAQSRFINVVFAFAKTITDAYMRFEYPRIIMVCSFSFKWKCFSEIFPVKMFQV